jgi:toxin ParE1/3/4
VSRISIEIPSEDHKRLEALAALEGKSIEEFVLRRTLAAARGSDEEQAILALEVILNERIRRAEAGEVNDQTVSEVFEEVYQEWGSRVS